MKFNTIDNYNRVCYATTVESWWITHDALLLGYIVDVLDWVEYQLEALFFLRCELPNSEQRKQKLSEYPQCLALVEDIEENWTLRNRFLNRQSDIANAALLWIEGRKPANRQAYELWIGFLAL